MFANIICFLIVIFLGLEKCSEEKTNEKFDRRLWYVDDNGVDRSIMRIEYLTGFPTEFVYFDKGLVKVSLPEAKRLCDDQNKPLKHKSLNLFNDAEKIGEIFFIIFKF